MIAKSILRRIADAPEEHKLADRATKSSERVDITFQDVADAVSVSKEPRRRQDRLRITDIARSIVDGLSKQEKQCVRLRCPATPIEVAGDASRIELVLQTLVRAGLTRANVSEPLEFALRRQNSMAIADCRVGKNRGARKLSPLGLDDWKIPTKIVEAHGGAIVAEGVASPAEPLHVVVRLPLAPEADHA